MSALRPSPMRIGFVAGPAGRWQIENVRTIAGEGLAPASRLAVVGAPDTGSTALWSLWGFTSNQRYTERAEAEILNARSAALMRPEATRAALIPIRKTPAWWALAQDERRAIFEAQSRHIAIGLEYLPGVARRLHHSRDLGESFDFLTWFEFAPEQEVAFDAMLARLRDTREWDYVDREVDIRLAR